MINLEFVAGSRPAKQIFPAFSRTAGKFAVNLASICDPVIALCRLLGHIPVGEILPQ
jgi:hypothetical protein